MSKIYMMGDVLTYDPPKEQSVYTKPKDWDMEMAKPKVKQDDCCASSEPKAMNKGLNLRQPL
jgi:hypothetical protein